MARIPQPFLFSWREIDAASDLCRLKLVMKVVPDEKLVRHLESLRGKGRNDYPVRPMWNALLAGVVFQHVSAASLLRELTRNGELRQVCGFDPYRGADAVPTEDAFGRFLANVVKSRELLQEVFDKVVEELVEALPNLGERLALDSKAVWSHGKPVRDENKMEVSDGRRDVDADWGVKKYQGVKENGKAWEKVTKWFGYKIHLVVDVNYEMPLGFKVTQASESDTTNMQPLLVELKDSHPEILRRCETVCADKGYDSTANNRDTYDNFGVKPVIDKREKLWQDGEPTRSVSPDVTDSFVYNERGEVFCVCPETGHMRSLAFMGFERERKALKYRCPAAAFGCECPGRTTCEQGKRVGKFGRVLRIPLDLNRRLFTPIARHSPQWKRTYDGRTAVERVNSRIETVLGFERHFIRGRAKMEMRITLGLVVLLSMALGRIRLGQHEHLRSFIAPVAAVV